MLIGEDVVHGQPLRVRRPEQARRRIVAHAHERDRRSTSTTPSPPPSTVTRAWSKSPADQRAAALPRAAGILRARRLELAALAVREAGKPWAEADGDVCEAIDFLEYYAHGRARARQRPAADPDAGRAQRDALRRPRRHRRDRAVELPARDRRRHGLRRARHRQRRRRSSPPSRRPRARRRSSTRCTPAASRTTRSACCRAATRPARRWSTTRASTRSSSPAPCAVGLQILQTAAKVVPGQRHLKRVIAEMGGKNCVIVDSDADLDDVVPGAAEVRLRVRRAEVLRAPPARSSTSAIADELAERLAGAISTLKVGPAHGLRHRRPAGDRHRRPAADPALHRLRDAAGPGRHPRRRLLRPADALRRPPGRLAGHPARRSSARSSALRDRRAASSTRASSSTRARSRSPAACSRRCPRTIEYVVRAHAGRQPLRQPRDHRRDGRPPAVRRRAPVRHRPEGGRPGLPAAVRRGARGHREHGAPRPRRV